MSDHSHSLASVTAVILAGGLGTRLHELVSDRPKVLASVAGKPFLSYLLERLGFAGVRKIVLCAGYMAEKVRAEYGHAYGGLELYISQESEPLGTGGAVGLAAAHIRSATAMVLNGDSFCPLDYADLLATHIQREADVSLKVVERPDTHACGRVTADDNCRIQRFVPKGASGEPGLVNAGVYLINRDLLASIPAATTVSLESELLPRWLERRCFAYRTRSDFIDIGTPAGYRACQNLFTSGGAHA